MIDEKRVLITGYNGFVGRNLLERLESEKKYTVMKFGREHNISDLKKFACDADFIFHLAGTNRPKEESEFLEGNVRLTKALVDILIENDKKSGIVFSSSIQAELDNPYGVSKALAEKELLRYQHKTGGPVYLYRLPNLFGKGVRPNYNSVVATFLFNIKYGKDITINDPDKLLTLVYINDLLIEFTDVLEGRREIRTGYYSIDKTYQITLKELAGCIYEIKACRICSNDIYGPLLETYLTY